MTSRGWDLASLLRFAMAMLVAIAVTATMAQPAAKARDVPVEAAIETLSDHGHSYDMAQSTTVAEEHGHSHAIIPGPIKPIPPQRPAQACRRVAGARRFRITAPRRPPRLP